MDKLFKTTLLTSTIVALLLLTWILTKVGQPQVCINSSIVESIDIESTNSLVNITGCSFLKSSTVPLKFKSISERVNTAADALRVLLHATQTPLAVTPIQLVLKINQPFAINVSPNRVLIGVDLFESEGQLERALLQALLLQNANIGFVESPLARELVTDFVMHLSTGDLSVYDPVSGRSTNGFLQFDKNWLKAFHNGKSLCDSAWRPAHLIDACTDGIIGSDKVISSWSLRPLLSMMTENENQTLSYNDKRSLIQKVIKHIRYTSWQDLPTRSHETVVSTLESAKIWSEFLGLKSDSLLEVASSIQNPELVVQSEVEDQPFEQSLLKQLSLSNKRVFISKADRMALYPTGPKFKLGDITVLPEHIIIRSKRALSVGVLKKTKSKDERVLQILDMNSKINIVSYINDGIESWMAINLKSTFRYYHIPSLKLAERWGLSETQTFDGQNPSKKMPRQLQALLGLKHPQFIAKANVNYVAGPLSVIEWFR